MDSAASSLGIDLVRVIAARFARNVCRHRMSAGCRLWRESIRDCDPVTPPLPSPPRLLVPRGEPPAVACLLCSGDRHHLYVPENAVGARFFGSWDGGWAFAALGGTSGHRLINMYSGERIDLPDAMLLVAGGSCELPVVIQAATLSSTVPILQETLAAAIVHVQNPRPLRDRPDLMFWRLGGMGRYSAGLICGIQPIDDLIYHHGEFYFLSVDEGIMVINPQLNHDDGVLCAPMVRLSIAIQHRYPYHQQVVARYLVESRGQLVMVSRFGLGRTPSTAGFRVFELSEVPQPEGEVIQARTLGQSCSYWMAGCFFYPASDFPGLDEGVYFKADVAFWRRGHFDRLTPDERGILTVDCGLWLGPLPGTITRCFDLPQQLPDLLDHSPPVWLLPESRQTKG